MTGQEQNGASLGAKRWTINRKVAIVLNLIKGTPPLHKLPGRTTSPPRI